MKDLTKIKAEHIQRFLSVFSYRHSSSSCYYKNHSCIVGASSEGIIVSITQLFERYFAEQYRNDTMEVEVNNPACFEEYQQQYFLFLIV